MRSKPKVSPSRRALLAALGATVAFPRDALARDYVDIGWQDLLPEGIRRVATPQVSGVIEHSQADLLSQQPASAGVRPELNGQLVRLPGYIVPLELDGRGVTSFILVPYVGACIHVPPPPANQIVLVDTAEPYEAQGLFEPVYVSGVIETATASTALADVGYQINASKVTPYD
ncbi:hypothetical protein BXY66_2569 [Shimia isoporae]|uniref:DUF3299 domain-containing protein n=1 Tax=Shimia isoporae TaxID=647720 RepID=A0A4R1N3G5_9RHOB|nr:DUF3299 domain-containing protein [Shimia isoporae]TCL01257.1 hypothetical protein BXY66_2569 [Shimia isoporae]